MTTTTWTVTGMTCGHCANAITDEVSDIDGVDSVQVDQPAGTMIINAETTVSVDAITAAVSEAGNYAAALRLNPEPVRP